MFQILWNKVVDVSKNSKWFKVFNIKLFAGLFFSYLGVWICFANFVKNSLFTFAFQPLVTIYIIVVV